MTFKTEAELSQHLARLLLERPLEGRLVFVRREVRLGELIPDVVEVQLSASAQRDWIPREWSYRHASLAWALRQHGGLTLEVLASAMFESAERISEVIEPLLRTGAVGQDREGRYSLRGAASRLKGKVMAFEAKLRSSRAALTQAMGYMEFADRVAVVIDGEAHQPFGDRKAVHNAAGLGLAVVRKRSLEWSVLPRRSAISVMGPYREYLLWSALSSQGQGAWSSRKIWKASRQATT